jgi:hypothetical protein
VTTPLTPRAIVHLQLHRVRVRIGGRLPFDLASHVPHQCLHLQRHRAHYHARRVPRRTRSVSQQQSSAARPDDAPVSVSKRTTPILSSAPRTMQRTTTCAIEWVRRCVDAKAASSNHARAGLTCHGRDATIAPIHSNAFLFASSNAALKRRKPSCLHRESFRRPIDGGWCAAQFVFCLCGLRERRVRSCRVRAGEWRAAVRAVRGSCRALVSTHAMRACRCVSSCQLRWWLPQRQLRHAPVVYQPRRVEVQPVLHER